jgi:Arc/MetJ family transcription regulator
VASVGKDTLYAQDINAYLDKVASSSVDSHVLVEKHITRWVRDKALFQTALENLPKQKTNKEEALQAYYETLIRQTYRNAFVNNKLDKEIREDTLQQYYKAKESQFKLNNPVCRVRYLALPPAAPKQDQLAFWFRSTKNYHLDSLFRYAQRHARSFALDNKQWYYYANLKDRFQLPASGREFLRKQQVYQTRLDSATVLHMAIQDHRLAGDIAPFPLVKGEIRQRLLNDRKQALLKNMEQAVLRQARQNGKIKRYE